MAKTTKRPVLTTAKVTKTSHPKAPWRCAYDAEVDGKKVRLRRMFASEDRAWLFAEERDRETKTHGIRFGDIPAEVRRAADFYRDARTEFRADGIEIPAFEALVMDAVANLRREHSDRLRNRVTVADAVELFTTYKTPRVSKRHSGAIKGQLTRFAKAFGTHTLDRVTSDEIEAWILALPGNGAVTRNKMRKVLKSLYAHGCAKTREWCDHNPLADLDKEKVSPTEPRAYSPEDSALILQTALARKSPILPSLVLGMFSGLRPSEILSLDLGAVNLDADGFRTPAVHRNGERTKTGARVAPLTAAGKAWLSAQTRRTGWAWQGTSQEHSAEMRAILEACGVKGIYDGARHSFITYRTAETRDVARVADEAGNSPNIIKKHYREIVTGEVATKFFAIRPATKAANVTSISEGRVA